MAGSSVRILAAGVGALCVIISSAIWIMIIGPLLNTLIPLMHRNTPEYWWNYLGGNSLSWIFPFIYILITLGGTLVIIRMVATATEVVDYDTGRGGW